MHAAVRVRVTLEAYSRTDRARENQRGSGATTPDTRLVRVSRFCCRSMYVYTDTAERKYTEERRRAGTAAAERGKKRGKTVFSRAGAIIKPLTTFLTECSIGRVARRKIAKIAGILSCISVRSTRCSIAIDLVQRCFDRQEASGFIDRMFPFTRALLSEYANFFLVRSDRLLGVFLLLSLEMYQKLAKIRLEIVHNIRFELDEIDDK